MAGKNCSYWHCQRLRPPLQRSPFWIPDLPVASSLFAFPSPNARLHAPLTKAAGDESAETVSLLAKASFRCKNSIFALNRGRIPSRSVMVLTLNNFSYCIFKGVRIQLLLLVILSLVNVCKSVFVGSEQNIKCPFLGNSFQSLPMARDSYVRIITGSSLVSFILSCNFHLSSHSSHMLQDDLSTRLRQYRRVNSRELSTELGLAKTRTIFKYHYTVYCLEF